MTEKPNPVQRFRRDYRRLREREGRGSGGEAELLALPFLVDGPMAHHWGVHARSFRRFLRRVLEPHAKSVGRPLEVVDIGAGPGWLCHRLARIGHQPVAVDLRLDDIDGLAAAALFASHLETMFPRVAATLERLPFADNRFDVAVFAASLHHASDLEVVLGETARVLRPGGRIAILDSPFYRLREHGEAMVEERDRATREHLADLADGLLALPGIGYLTRESLAQASAPSGLRWRRHRVLYPLWYEWRPVKAFLRRRRPPSRFDVWEGVLP